MSDTPEIRAEKTSQITTSTAYYAGEEILYIDREKHFFGPYPVNQEAIVLDPDRIKVLIDTDQQTVEDLTVNEPRRTRIATRIAGAGFAGATVASYFLKFGTWEVFGATGAAILAYGEIAYERLSKYKRKELERATGRIATYQALLPEGVPEADQLT